MYTGRSVFYLTLGGDGSVATVSFTLLIYCLILIEEARSVLSLFVKLVNLIGERWL